MFTTMSRHNVSKWVLIAAVASVDERHNYDVMKHRAHYLRYKTASEQIRSVLCAYVCKYRIRYA